MGLKTTEFLRVANEGEEFRAREYQYRIAGILNSQKNTKKYIF